MSDRLRVAQWATGNIGTRSLRAVIEHPGLELVGLHVHSPEKAGRDAGDLCGTGPVGIVATTDIDDVIALRPDCVLHMPQGCDFDELCRLLSAGINVVTTRGELHHPPSLDPDVRERVEAACAAGASTIHCTGSSPGFVTEALPIVLTSLQRRLDAIVIDEFADLSERDSPNLLFDIMGFGKEPSKFDARRWAHGAAAFGPSLRAFADAIGLPLDAVEGDGEVAVAGHDVQIAAGPVAAGTVAAQRMVVRGMHEGRALLTFRTGWYCTTDLDPAWDMGATGWRVVVEGDVPFTLDLVFDIPLERMAATTPGITAHRAVNAVPAVCAAEPGIRTTAELPQVIARLG